MQKLSLRAARRVAVRATRLDRPQPTSILEVTREAGPLQLDPTNAVARSERLVLWSRLGRYDPAELDRLLWEERALFTWRAFLYPVEGWPFVAAAAQLYPPADEGRGGQVRRWLADNRSFERYVLYTLARKGPTRQSELEDRAARPWESTGWTNAKNVSQLLEFLWAQGKVLVSARVGQERVWDLAERVVAPAPPLDAQKAARIQVERLFHRHGLMTAAGFKRVPSLWLLPLRDAFTELVAEAVLVPVAIEGVRGTWYAHRDTDLGTRAFRGRTTLLSPFDPLVYDRTRALDLFGFRYRLEIYVPKAKREFGYFVLPILHGDALVGRIDPLYDRKSRTLHVHRVFAEEGASENAGPAVAKAIADLAKWLGAEHVAVGEVAPVWRDAFAD